MNPQTPGMLSHPPIQVNDLTDHIDDLKVGCHDDDGIRDDENVHVYDENEYNEDDTGGRSSEVHNGVREH